MPDSPTGKYKDRHYKDIEKSLQTDRFAERHILSNFRNKKADKQTDRQVKDKLYGQLGRQAARQSDKTTFISHHYTSRPCRQTGRKISASHNEIERQANHQTDKWEGKFHLQGSQAEKNTSIIQNQMTSRQKDKYTYT